ncbi:hypothetical protein [Halomonas binhaiensis]|uniref:DUF3108 domain-containing protein n=1 Tax=Halomonas binhaiensis TaxID=2562282 RepID=A0A5C1NGF4_9GAMM|nr:hypothetical protein [Halomonas binhaiensis]QEM82772.1 hypothetical protein E4T21_15375 [Halomonas binhaiensis]
MTDMFPTFFFRLMSNVRATCPGRLFRRTSLATALLAFSLVALPVLAQASALRAFDANYHLSVDGWPDANIHHSLKREGDHWRSSMESSLAIAKGRESSQFSDNGDQLRALGYRSDYRFLRMGKDYSLNRSQLTNRPDRQTALVELSRLAQEQDCQDGCELNYVDHKGRNEDGVWRRVADIPLQVDGKRVQAPTVELRDKDKDDRYMRISFHPQIPGLLLRLDFFKDGDRVSRLRLTRLNQ